MNTSAALLPKATKETASQTRMKMEGLEGLVCSDNLTHNLSFMGEKYMYHVAKTRFCHSISAKEARKDSTAAIGAGGRGGITKFGIFSPHDEPLAALHRETLGICFLPGRKLQQRQEKRQDRIEAHWGSWPPDPQAGEFQLSKCSIPKPEQHDTILPPPAPSQLPRLSPVTQALHREWI